MVEASLQGIVDKVAYEGSHEDAPASIKMTVKDLDLYYGEFHALKNIKRDKILRLTMLFHDMGKPMMKTTDENGRDHWKSNESATYPPLFTDPSRGFGENDSRNY